MGKQLPPDHTRARHTGLEMPRHQTGKAERAELGELPDQLAGLARRAQNGIGIVERPGGRSGPPLAGVAALHRRGEAHLRDLPEQDRLAFSRTDCEVLQIGETRSAADSARW